jgi:hypothetical protein
VVEGTSYESGGAAGMVVRGEEGWMQQHHGGCMMGHQWQCEM